jgi:hypothetical protein
MCIPSKKRITPGNERPSERGFFAESRISVMRRAVKVVEPFDDAV